MYRVWRPGCLQHVLHRHDRHSQRLTASFVRRTLGQYAALHDDKDRSVHITSVGAAGLSKRALKIAFSGEAPQRDNPTIATRVMSPRVQQYGEDACFFGHGSFFGVADGIGGWKKHGVDPAAFSQALMNSCLIESENVGHSDPQRLLIDAFRSTEAVDPQVIGASTAIIGHVDESNGKVVFANLGDSGYRLVRGGKVIAESSEQRHSFFTPLQLTVAPPHFDVLRDQPEQAEVTELETEPGDTIIAASDGLFDNMYNDEIEDEMKQFQKNRYVPASEIAEALVMRSVNFMGSSDRMSPFAARANEDDFCMLGGKKDDITVCVVQLG